MQNQLNQIRQGLEKQGYIPDDNIVMSIKLSQQLQKPLLIEGPAGVGKTAIAKVMADMMDTELIRLQCYEGLDAYQAIYEWNYPHQLLHIKMLESQGYTVEQKEAELFSGKFLMERPLLNGIALRLEHFDMQ
ncbi:MAG: MoxR family ATPase [Cyclobacteriaceae bacterium]